MIQIRLRNAAEILWLYLIAFFSWLEHRCQDHCKNTEDEDTCNRADNDAALPRVISFVKCLQECRSFRPLLLLCVNLEVLHLRHADAAVLLVREEERWELDAVDHDSDTLHVIKVRLIPTFSRVRGWLMNLSQLADQSSLFQAVSITATQRLRDLFNLHTATLVYILDIILEHFSCLWLASLLSVDLWRFFFTFAVLLRCLTATSRIDQEIVAWFDLVDFTDSHAFIITDMSREAIATLVFLTDRCKMLLLNCLDWQGSSYRWPAW